MARQTIQLSPLMLGGAIALGSGTCFYGLGPAVNLVASVAMGFVWFAILVLAWRMRSEVIRVSSLLFIIFGQGLVWHHYVGGDYFKIVQGWSVSMAVGAGLIWFLRSWVGRVARLEENVI